MMYMYIPEANEDTSMSKGKRLRMKRSDIKIELCFNDSMSSLSSSKYTTLIIQMGKIA